MKKYLSLLLALFMTMALTACGGNADTPGSGSTDTPSSGTSAPSSRIRQAENNNYPIPYAPSMF